MTVKSLTDLCTRSTLYYGVLYLSVIILSLSLVSSMDTHQSASLLLLQPVFRASAEFASIFIQKIKMFEAPF